MLQLSDRDLVDEDVLAVEQARIRRERAEVAKWAKTATRDIGDVSRTLAEALQLLNAAGAARQLAAR